ncbi:hypothetical protein GCM10023116_16790 [Kistimonas scapharcae]|uniref:Uncharacterized protein n=1 Tax=Kistimonas scapharcae TaxID=1036133 RepID=A0ABP8V268_9GAMM
MLSKPMHISESPSYPTASGYHQNDSDSDPEDDSYSMQLLPANSLADRIFSVICCRRVQQVTPETIPLLTEVTETSVTHDGDDTLPFVLGNDDDTLPFVLGNFEKFATQQELFAYEIKNLSQHIAGTLAAITTDRYFLESIFSYSSDLLTKYNGHILSMRLCLIDALTRKLYEIYTNPEDYLTVQYNASPQTNLIKESARIIRDNHFEAVNALRKPVLCNTWKTGINSLTIEITSTHTPTSATCATELACIHEKTKKQLRERALINVQHGRNELLKKIAIQLKSNMQKYAYSIRKQHDRNTTIGASLNSTREFSNIDIRRFVSRLQALSRQNLKAVDFILCYLLADTTYLINEALTKTLPHYLGFTVNISPGHQQTTFTIMESSNDSKTESIRSENSSIRIAVSLFHPDKDIAITPFPQPLNMKQINPSPDSVSLRCDLIVLINPRKPDKPKFSGLKVLMTLKQRRLHSSEPSFGLKH